MNCNQCKKEFYSKNKNRPNRYCSQGCWRKYESEKAHQGICGNCGKTGILTKRKYCSHQCYSQTLQTALKGKNNPHYKERIRKICPVCSKDFYVLPSRVNVFIHCSSECSFKRKKTKKETETARKLMKDRNWVGENNPGWKGGITKLQLRLRQSTKYKEWRKAVYKRDKHTCQHCDHKGYIEAHHIRSFSSILRENEITDFDAAMECKELWNINNGLTLCKKCHKKTDSYGSNRDQNTSCEATVYNLTR